MAAWSISSSLGFCFVFYHVNKLRNKRSKIIRSLKFTWSAEGLSWMTDAASFNAWDAFCSPSAAMTLALASLAASASAAMALWSCTGSLTSLLEKFKHVKCTDYLDDFYMLLTFQLSPLWRPKGPWLRRDLIAWYARWILSRIKCQPSSLCPEHYAESLQPAAESSGWKMWILHYKELVLQHFVHCGCGNKQFTLTNGEDACTKGEIMARVVQASAKKERKFMQMWPSVSSVMAVCCIEEEEGGNKSKWRHRASFAAAFLPWSLPLWALCSSLYVLRSSSTTTFPSIVPKFFSFYIYFCVIRRELLLIFISAIKCVCFFSRWIHDTDPFALVVFPSLAHD